MNEKAELKKWQEVWTIQMAARLIEWMAQNH